MGAASARPSSRSTPPSPTLLQNARAFGFPGLGQVAPPKQPRMKLLVGALLLAATAQAHCEPVSPFLPGPRPRNTATPEPRDAERRPVPRQVPADGHQWPARGGRLDGGAHDQDDQFARQQRRLRRQQRRHPLLRRPHGQGCRGRHRRHRARLRRAHRHHALRPRELLHGARPRWHRHHHLGPHGRRVVQGRQHQRRADWRRADGRRAHVARLPYVDPPFLPYRNVPKRGLRSRQTRPRSASRSPRPRPTAGT